MHFFIENGEDVMSNQHQQNWGKPQGNESFSTYKKKAIAAPSEIKKIVDSAITAFIKKNMFGIPGDICQQIIDSFNELEGIEGEFAHNNLEMLPAKMTHIGGSSDKAFAKVFPSYGQRAMAFGALSMTVENALRDAKNINGFAYGVFTEFSNTNWSDVNRAGLSKQSVQQNTYNVYRLWVTPVGPNGAALSPSALYGYKVQQQQQAQVQSPAAPVQQQGWGSNNVTEKDDDNLTPW